MLSKDVGHVTRAPAGNTYDFLYRCLERVMAEHIVEGSRRSQLGNLAQDPQKRQGLVPLRCAAPQPVAKGAEVAHATDDPQLENVMPSCAVGQLSSTYT